MADGYAQIIIKKVKKGGHGGHHGGAWKVAYADFVTAMMAFFLLLWLLNATSSEQKIGIANYFDPTAISSSSSSGSGGVMGGKTLSADGAMVSDTSPPSINDAAETRPPAPETEGGESESDSGDGGDSAGKQTSQSDALESRQGPGDLQNSKRPPFGDPDEPNQLGETGDAEATTDATGNAETGDQQILNAKIEEMETERFENFEKDLRRLVDEAILEDPNLLEAARNLKIDSVPAGLRIQLIDKEKMDFFPSGSADMFESTEKLLAKVSQLLSKMPNKIKISGHTDATKFSPGSTYTNWELSADRALASRRALIANGIPSERITEVVGRADREPIAPEEPTSATNRRISIVLVRQSANDQGAVAAAEAALQTAQ